MRCDTSYILITPAHNEEAFIENTIASVIAQTVLPKKWVIVSDGSTDRTDEIVGRYEGQYDWIKFLRLPEHRDRQFAAKVSAFNAGYEEARDIMYDVIGNLDADITFESDYLEFLIRQFYLIPELGVAGTPFVENNYSSVDDSFEGENHVAGGCQLFRRKCFEEIGGYVPIKGGGIDWIAVTTARMNGWKTISFREKYFFHHRKLGTGDSTNVRAIFDYGMKDWFLGGHPLWEVFRVLYRIAKRPYAIGGLCLIAGYIWALLGPTERAVSDELMRFHRKEQIEKLRVILKRSMLFRKIDQFRFDK